MYCTECVVKEVWVRCETGEVTGSTFSVSTQYVLQCHTCIDRVTCIDHMTWHRSHDMLDFVTVWLPPGIEILRYSIFRTSPCFDTGGHRCHGVHIMCTDIAAHVASPWATAPRHSQYLLCASPTSLVNRHVVAWIELQVMLDWSYASVVSRWSVNSVSRLVFHLKTLSLTAWSTNFFVNILVSIRIYLSLLI